MAQNPPVRCCQKMCGNGKFFYWPFRRTGKFKDILGQRPFLGMTDFAHEWQFP